MDKKLWATKGEAADLCGLGVRQFSDTVQPRLGKGEARGKGNTLRFHAPAVVAALVAYRLEQVKPAQVITDPLMAGPDTQALEEFRRYRAGQERIKLSEMERQSIPRGLLEASLAQFAGILRGAGESLTRQFGNDAGELLNDAVDDWERGIEKLFASDDDTDRPDGRGPAPGGGTGPNAPAADDAAVR